MSIHPGNDNPQYQHNTLPQYQAGYQQMPPMVVGYQQPPPMKMVPGYQPLPQYQGGYQQMPPMVVGGYGGPNHVIPTQTQPFIKKTGFQKLNDVSGIFIKQKIELFEVMTGLETPNTYYVYALNHEGEKKGQKLLKGKEKSHFFARQCFSGDCRPFTMKLLNEHNESGDHDTFLELDRPCKCTFFCLQRPEITIKHKEGGHEILLGTLIAPFAFCDLQIDIYDSNKTLKYKIVGSCCQLGIFCKCPCDSCQLIQFEIRSPTGEKLCNLIKKSAGCHVAMFTDASNFIVDFPNHATPEDKALIMCATIFLDYRYFEENAGNNQRRR